MAIERDLRSTFETVARGYPIVTVTGPRQSGKTTFCRMARPDLPYVSLEAPDRRRSAAEDPRGFLSVFAGGAIIDEVQRVPDLVSYLQVEVDRDATPGRFILTGSENLSIHARVSQSLAGRTSMLRLLPPSLNELERFPTFRPDLGRLLQAGAYPRPYDRGIDVSTWISDYVQTYVQRDVREILNIGDLERFMTFLRMAAGRTAQEQNLVALGADVGVSSVTARAWMSVLEASFIVHRVPAFFRNLGKRWVKAPKLHFIDTGLAAWLFGVRAPEHIAAHPLRGALFESFVAGEILKSRANRGLPADLYHWRETRGREIDLVVEGADAVRLVEVKSAATIPSDFIRPVSAAREALIEAKEHRKVEGYVVYGGETRESIHGVTILPWREIHTIAW